MVSCVTQAGAESSSIAAGDVPSVPTAFTVTASSPGLESGTIVVTLSIDPEDTVLRVASRNVETADPLSP